MEKIINGLVNFGDRLTSVNSIRVMRSFSDLFTSWKTSS
jgi:hypothetical protein